MAESAALKSRKKNGTMVQMLVTITAGSAMDALFSHSTGWEISPSRSSTALMMPPSCRYMRRNRNATTTNGTAHGVSSSARTDRNRQPTEILGQQRQRKPEHRRDDDAAERVDRGVAQRTPEDRISDQRPVIAEPDEPGGATSARFIFCADRTSV